MQRLITFLAFQKNGKQAVDFYCKVFKDSHIENLMLMPGSDMLLHAEFSLCGQTYMAMDVGEGHHNFTFTDSISLYVSCNNQEEVDYYWESLLGDGGEEMPCGWLKDKFGVRWQVIPKQLGELIGGSDQEKSGRAMQAMFKMKKIIIADLESAYNGQKA